MSKKKNSTILYRFLKKFYDLRIRSKFFLVILTIVLFITGLTLTVIYYREKSIILDQVKQRALDITTLLAFNGVQAVVNNNYLELQSLVDGISNRKGVIETMVLDNEGNVLAHNYTSKRGQKYQDVRSKLVIQSQAIVNLIYKQNTNRILDVSVPVIILSHKKATARILFSLEEAYTSIYKTSMHIALIGFIGVIISIFLSYLLSRIITKPILRLVTATNKVSRGKWNIQIETKFHDEIGQLAVAFNKMVKDIMALEENIRQSERLTAIGLAAASLAHKIKTPLTSIRTFIEMFPERYSDAQFRELFQYHVSLEVGHLNEIMNELSRFSRERALSPSKIDINYLILNIQNILQERIQKTDIKITIQKDELLLIWADKEQLTEAFLVIGENALEAMVNKGQLLIQTELIKGDSNDTDDRNKVKITFSDTGSGIAPVNLERIFEPFISTKSKGMGIGLAICADIIRKHGGTIQVKSELNKGTTFEIFLPVVEV